MHTEFSKMIFSFLLFPNNNGMFFQKVYMFLLSIVEYLEYENNSIIPQILQNIGLALLSILIPLAIVILTQVYEKKGSKTKDFSVLDLHVILDHVFQIKLLVTKTMMIFLPLIFWDASSGYFRLGEIILSLFGISLLIITVLNVYRWIKGNVFEFRFEYLKKVINPSDLEVVWRSVWESKIGLSREKEFFEVFSKKIDEMVKKFAK